MKIKDGIEPIQVWFDLISSNMEREEIKTEFVKLFSSFYPYAVGMIMSPACLCKCAHCIYPPNYDEYNTDLPIETWKDMVKGIYDDLNIKVFVHNGRSFDDRGIELLGYIKNYLKDSRVGIIDNGYDLSPYWDKLSIVKPDWIDISIDGMETDHDRQRSKRGLFKRALKAVHELNERGITQNVNILTCLTTINQHSVIEMIRFLSTQGVHNYFISPVSIRKNFRPSPKLKLKQQDFIRFINDLYVAMNDIAQVFVEINLFDAEYLSFLLSDNRFQLKGCEKQYDHLVWRFSKGRNELVVSFYPLSIDGVREFIVNSNGDVLTPKAMARGRIVDHEKLGSLLVKTPQMVRNELLTIQGFEAYINEFYDERNILSKGD